MKRDREILSLLIILLLILSGCGKINTEYEAEQPFLSYLWENPDSGIEDKVCVYQDGYTSLMYKRWLRNFRMEVVLSPAWIDSIQSGFEEADFNTFDDEYIHIPGTSCSVERYEIRFTSRETTKTTLIHSGATIPSELQKICVLLGTLTCFIKDQVDEGVVLILDKIPIVNWPFVDYLHLNDIGYEELYFEQLSEGLSIKTYLDSLKQIHNRLPLFHEENLLVALGYLQNDRFHLSGRWPVQFWSDLFRTDTSEVKQHGLHVQGDDYHKYLEIARATWIVCGDLTHNAAAVWVDTFQGEPLVLEE